MLVDLMHFPNFQKGIFTGAVKDGLLPMLIEIRQQLDCRHITHVAHSDDDKGEKDVTPSVSMLTTLPMNWMHRYIVKNYFAVDPIMQGMTLFPRKSDVPGTIRNLTTGAGLSTEAGDYLRDCRMRRLGNLFLAVCTSNVYGFRGITLFTFDVNSSNDFSFIEQMRKELATASAQIHGSIHRDRRNPAPSTNPLTRREADCLHWAAKGKTDEEIAQILGIGRWTVITYLKNAKNKLECSNRTSTVVTALALGIIEMPIVTKLFDPSQIEN